MVDALHEGSTLWEVIGVCSRNFSGGTKDWTESSVRSALYYDINRVKRYGVRTEVMTPRAAHDAGHEASVEEYLGTDREHEAFVQVYFLVLPEGLDAPLPHVESAAMRAAANTQPKAKKRAKKS